MIDWDNIGWGDSTKGNDNVLDINNHIIISGIVTKWQFNKGNTYFLVTLDHGNGTETVIAIDSSIKLDIEANDYLKCCADLNAFNTDLILLIGCLSLISQILFSTFIKTLAQVTNQFARLNQAAVSLLWRFA